MIGSNKKAPTKLGLCIERCHFNKPIDLAAACIASYELEAYSHKYN